MIIATGRAVSTTLWQSASMGFPDVQPIFQEGGNQALRIVTNGSAIAAVRSPWKVCKLAWEGIPGPGHAFLGARFGIRYGSVFGPGNDGELRFRMTSSGFLTSGDSSGFVQSRRNMAPPGTLQVSGNVGFYEFFPSEDFAKLWYGGAPSDEGYLLLGYEGLSSTNFQSALQREDLGLIIERLDADGDSADIFIDHLVLQLAFSDEPVDPGPGPDPDPDPVNGMLRETVLQKPLIGLEATRGATAPATRRLTTFDIELNSTPAFREHRPAGVKLPTHQILHREHAEGSITGILSYDELGFALASAVAKPVSQSLGGGVYQHTFQINPYENDDFQTFTVEKGHAPQRTHRSSFLWINQLGLDFQTSDNNLTGSVIGRAIEDGVTQTPGANAVQRLSQWDAIVGTIVLEFKGARTPEIGPVLSASALEEALEDLPTIGEGNVTVTVDGGDYVITFIGDLAGREQPAIRIAANNLEPEEALVLNRTVAGGYLSMVGDPIQAGHVSLFVADSIGQLGDGQLVRAFSSSLELSGRAAPVFRQNEADERSFGEIAEQPLDFTLGFEAEAGAEGMALLASARDGDRLYARVRARGPLIGSSGIRRSLTIDLPCLVSAVNPYGSNQEVYSIGFTLTARPDLVAGEEFQIVLVNEVEAYA